MEREKIIFRNEPYMRTALYYETDQMGIIHHSNYIRWMEEARLDILEKLGINYDRIEKEGIQIPVLGVACDYQKAVHFNDTVAIYTCISHFNGITMEVEYEIRSEDGSSVHATGHSRHCFVNAVDFKPISLKKANSSIYEILLKEYEAQDI